MLFVKSGRINFEQFFKQKKKQTHVCVPARVGLTGDFGEIGNTRCQFFGDERGDEG